MGALILGAFQSAAIPATTQGFGGFLGSAMPPANIQVICVVAQSPVPYTSPGPLSDIGLASFLQSNADATELCLGPEAEMAVASLLQQSRLDPCRLALP